MQTIISNSWILVALIAAILFLLLFAKKIIWWLFSFDKKVAHILSQTKSSEVRLGKISESLSPLLENFPVDPHAPGTTLCPLGQPLDFVYFDPENGITFIEVKSGDSKLSPSQKKLKKCIEDGKVFWAEFRVK